MEEDRAVLRLRRMPAEGAVRSQGVLEVFQGDYQGSYEISPWPVTVDGTEALSRHYRGRLHYINGLRAMDTPGGLSSDGLHPSDQGHEMIAERPAGYMAEKRRID